jgi:hypothetical protein
MFALAHLRGALPYESVCALFFLSSKQTAWSHTDRVLQRLAELARERTRHGRPHRGSVRFLSDDELNQRRPERFAAVFPNLRAMADCFPVYVEWPASCNPLNHLLYDGLHHKGRWWVKFLLVVAPNGYIMYIGGPYAPAGKAADGRLLTREMLKSGEFWAFACAGGTWLVDYGFKGVRVPPNVDLRMPLKWTAERQGTAEEIAHNDAITGVRWVVEAANERVKNWRFFNAQVRRWSEIPRMPDYLAAVCFLFNRWNKPIVR